MKPGRDQESDIIRGKSNDTRRVFIIASEGDGMTWKTGALRLTENGDKLSIRRADHLLAVCF